MNLRVHLRDTVTGFARIYETEVEDDEGLHYMWGEGNYSCDCNRSLFLWDWSDEEGEVLDCNSMDNQIVIDRMTLDGEIWLKGDPADE